MQPPRTDADYDPAAAWMEKLAALPPASGSAALPSAEVLWWRAQALRRLDEQRRVSVKLEIGERIQAACLIVGNLALLGWLLGQASALGQLPAYVLAGAVCVPLVAIGAVLALWSERSGS